MHDMNALKAVYQRALANQDQVSEEDMLVLDSLADDAEREQIGDDITIHRPRWGSKAPYKKSEVRAKAKAAKKARKQNRK